MLSELETGVSHAVDFPENRSAPIFIEVTRGGMIESIHRGICVISDSKGSIYKSWGDHERPIYPRSAIKPLQAIPVVASGAAAALKMSSAELALCCASHSGERVHTEKVASWLKRLGLDDTNLECGPQMPSDQETAEKLIQSGKNPLSLHNNCSGKHAGMLSTAIHNKQPTLGYTKADHPVQSDLIRLMSSLGNLDLSKTARGLDGCGIPVFGIPVKSVALAMAKFADPDILSQSEKEACIQIREACAQNPIMISGTNKINTLIQAETADKAVVKGGAEGVYTAAINSLGLGVCIKVDDGAGRAASVVMLHVLRKLNILNDESVKKIKEFGVKDIRNWSGTLVGEIRVGGGISF